jgi:hypothetical protein
VGHAVHIGRSALIGADSDRPSSAAALLARPHCTSDPDVDVHLSPALVADLHEPRLVITPDYVGADRRRGVRTTVVDRPRTALPHQDDRRQLLRPVGVIAAGAALVALAVALAFMVTTARVSVPTRTLPVGTTAKSSAVVATPRTPRTTRTPRPPRSAATARTAKVAHAQGARQSPLDPAARHQSAVTAAADRRTTRAARIDVVRTARQQRRRAQVAAQAQRRATKAARVAARAGRQAPA